MNWSIQYWKMSNKPNLAKRLIKFLIRTKKNGCGEKSSFQQVVCWENYKSAEL